MNLSVTGDRDWIVMKALEEDRTRQRHSDLSPLVRVPSCALVRRFKLRGVVPSRAAY
jgi:hypothetical protein